MIAFLSMIDDPNDREFMDQIYTEYRELCLDVVSGILGNLAADSAEDVVQNSMLSASRHIDKLRSFPVLKQRRYIVKAAKRRAIDYMERRGQYTYLDDEPSVKSSPYNESAEDAVLLKWYVQEIKKALSALPEKDYLIFDQRQDGMGYDEIMKEFHYSSEASARSAYSKVVNKIQRAVLGE